MPELLVLVSLILALALVGFYAAAFKYAPNTPLRYGITVALFGALWVFIIVAGLTSAQVTGLP